MKNNLSQIEEYVHTQYGDLTGVIKIDGHNNIACIYDLCKDHGFDTENVFLVGFGLGESTIDGIGRANNIVAKYYILGSLNMEIVLTKLILILN